METVKEKIIRLRGYNELGRFGLFMRRRKLRPTLSNFQVWARAINVPQSKRKYYK